MKLSDIVEIICKEHGSFYMTVGDHLGENKEKIAYGCNKCGDYKLINK
jgi:hypothetical protein